MNISKDLRILTIWSKAAIFAYAGDILNNIYVDKLTNHEFKFPAITFVYLSGLYRALKPLDAISCIDRNSNKTKEINLTNFWQAGVTKIICNKILAKHENKSVINTNKLKYQLVNIHFKENRNSKLPAIGINTKKARGAMVDVIANNLIDSPKLLKDFSYLGYEFSTERSSDSEIFIKN